MTYLNTIKSFAEAWISESFFGEQSTKRANRKRTTHNNTSWNLVGDEEELSGHQRLARTSRQVDSSISFSMGSSLHIRTCTMRHTTAIFLHQLRSASMVARISNSFHTTVRPTTLFLETPVSRGTG